MEGRTVCILAAMLLQMAAMLFCSSAVSWPHAYPTSDIAAPGSVPSVGAEGVLRRARARA